MLYSHTWQPEEKLTLLCACWYQAHPRGNFRSGRIARPYWTFDYSYTYCGQVRAGSESAPWRERVGRVAHIYAPDCPYWEANANETLLTNGGYFVFRNEPGFGFERLINPEYGYAHIIDPDGTIAEPLEAMGRLASQEGAASYWGVMGYFHLIHHILLSSIPTEGPDRRIPSASEELPFAVQVMDILRANMTEGCCLYDVARQLGCSESSLSHRFRAETGQTPIQALIGMRIEASKAMILRGDRLDAIARATGFHDAFHLSRAFKKAVGCSPAAYRRRS